MLNIGYGYEPLGVNICDSVASLKYILSDNLSHELSYRELQWSYVTYIGLTPEVSSAPGVQVLSFVESNLSIMLDLRSPVMQSH